MRIFAFYITLLLTLSACALPSLAPPAYTQIPVASVFVLHQSLPLEPGEAGVYLQHGKVLSATLPDRYRPNCRVEINRVDESPRRIAAGEYVLSRIHTDEDFAGVAALKLAALGGLFGDSFIQNYRTVFSLQPHRLTTEGYPAQRLICQHWEDAANALHLNLAQIRQALGRVVEIQLSRSE